MEASRVPLSLHGMLEAAPQSHGCTFRTDTSSQGRPRLNSGMSQSSDESQRRCFTPYHSQSVPKSQNLASRRGSAETTTMMLRNIPNKFTQNTLMEEIDDFGFEGLYDFFYLPMDVHNRSNVGYAFINFLDPADAERFGKEFGEHRFQKIWSRKVSSVCVAYVQGLDENLRHFENRAVTHSRNDQYRPVVLKHGSRVDFEVAMEEAKMRLDGRGPVLHVNGQLHQRPDVLQEDQAYDEWSSYHPSAWPVPPAEPAGNLSGARHGLEAAIRQMLTQMAPVPQGFPAPVDKTLLPVAPGARPASYLAPAPPGLCHPVREPGLVKPSHASMVSTPPLAAAAAPTRTAGTKLAKRRGAGVAPVAQESQTPQEPHLH